MHSCVKLSLLFGFLGITFSSQAQYQSIFGANQTVWKTSNCGALSAPCFVDIANTTGNDTVINNRVFKEMRSFTANPTVFYIAEDTTTGSVWHKYLFPSGLSIHSKLMDMTLNVNDSFLFVDTISGWKYKVDSVYVENSRKVIRFDHQFPVTVAGANRPTVKLKMIEGIGLNIGIDLNGIDGFGVYLLCQEKDSVRVFETTEHPTFNCNSSSTSIKETSFQNQITISPNPASTFVELDLNGLVAREIELLDVKGSLLKTFTIADNRLDISEIESGIYFLKIYLNAGFVSKKPMVAK